MKLALWMIYGTISVAVVFIGLFTKDVIESMLEKNDTDSEN